MSYPPVLILIIEERGGGEEPETRTFMSYGQIFRFSHEEINFVPERPYR